MKRRMNRRYSRRLADRREVRGDRMGDVEVIVIRGIGLSVDPVCSLCGRVSDGGKSGHSPALRTSSVNFASMALGSLASKSSNPLDSLLISEDDANWSSSSSSSQLLLSLPGAVALRLDFDSDPPDTFNSDSSGRDLVDFLPPTIFSVSGDGTISSSSDELRGMFGRV